MSKYLHLFCGQLFLKYQPMLLLKSVLLHYSLLRVPFICLLFLKFLEVFWKISVTRKSFFGWFFEAEFILCLVASCSSLTCHYSKTTWKPATNLDMDFIGKLFFRIFWNSSSLAFARTSQEVWFLITFLYLVLSSNDSMLVYDVCCICYHLMYELRLPIHKTRFLYKLSFNRWFLRSLWFQLYSVKIVTGTG